MKTERENKAKIKNFTPLLDDLVQNHGVITAAVWGRVWRYAQQENHVCQASTNTIASELGISKRTVVRHLSILVQDGYLKDHTPEMRNRPHTYSITKKARILITIEGVTESHTKGELGVTESPTGVTLCPDRCDRESHEETNKKQIKKQYGCKLPDKLATDEFIEAWNEWEKYREEARKTLKPTTVKRQLMRLEKYDVKIAVAMLYQAIEKQWTGIYELKNSPKNQNGTIISNKDSSFNV